MERMQRFYDRFGAKFTIHTASMYLALYSFMLCLAALRFRHYFRTHEASDKYFGALLFLVGAIGLFHAIQVFRAIARRNHGDGR